jgi:hypothetical protein
VRISQRESATPLVASDHIQSMEESLVATEQTKPILDKAKVGNFT